MFQTTGSLPCWTNPTHYFQSYQRLISQPLSYFKILSQNACHHSVPAQGVHLIPRLDIVKTLNILFTLNTPHTRRFWLPLHDGSRLAVAFQSRGTFLLKCQGDMKQSPITPDQMTDIIYIQSILKRVKLFRIWLLFCCSFVFNIQLLAYWWTYQSNKPWRSL